MNVSPAQMPSRSREGNWPKSQTELLQQTAQIFNKTVQNPQRHEMPLGELAWYLSERLRELGFFDANEAITRRVPQIASFTYACAPARASAHGLKEAAEFLIVFFLLNDHWPSDLSYVPRPRGSQITSEAQHVADYMHRVEEDYGKRAVHYLAAIWTYVRSLDNERQLRISGQAISMEQYRDPELGRFQWVGTPPYIDLWEMTDLTLPCTFERTPLLRLRALGVEMTYIANDMGSLLRDGEGANIVHLLSPDDPEDGLRRAALQYKQLAESFLAEAKIQESGPSPVRDYVDMVAGVVDGNRDMTAGLTQLGGATRYASEVATLVESLPALGFPCS